MQEQASQVPEAPRVSEYANKQATIDAAVREQDPLLRYLSASDELRKLESQIVNDLNVLHSSGKNAQVHDKLRTWAMLKVYVASVYGGALDTRTADDKAKKGKDVVPASSSYTELVNTLNNSKNWRIHVATFYRDGVAILEAAFPDFVWMKKSEEQEFKRQVEKANDLLEKQVLSPEAAAVAGTSGDVMMTSSGSSSPKPPTTAVSKKGRGSESSQRPSVAKAGEKRPQGTGKNRNDEDIIELVELALDGFDINEERKQDQDHEDDDLGEWIPAPASGTDKEE